MIISKYQVNPLALLLEAAGSTNTTTFANSLDTVSRTSGVGFLLVWTDRQKATEGYRRSQQTTRLVWPTRTPSG